MEALVLPRCNIGVEIEIEKALTALLKTKPKYWHIKEDGSLREGGAELVFARPMQGEEAINALKEAFEVLLNKKMQISPRTGIHVHVDAQDMGMRELRLLCVLYALTEEPLFEWVGNHRHTNQFCLPWYEAEGDIEIIANMVTQNKLGIKKQAAGIHRYAALNLNAINKFGSVEFRHLQTTLDLPRVLTWVNLLMSLKKVAMTYEHSANHLLSAFSDMGKSKFVSSIFGKLSKELNPSCINLGIQLAQELCSGEIQKAPENGFYAHLFKIGVPEGYSNFREKKKKGL